MIDPRDDQVRAAAQQPELGEADAVDRGAVGGEAVIAVAEIDLLDGERRAGRDAARGSASVGVRSDHIDLDPVQLAQRPPHRLQARRRDPVVVGQQDSHSSILGGILAPNGHRPP